MSLPFYSLDTNVQFWFLSDPTRLSASAKAVFDEARQGRARLLLSHVVVAELYFLLRKQQLESSFLPFLNRVRMLPEYHLEGITLDDLEQLPQYTDIPEMHDRLIAIQANRHGAALVTSDAVLRASSRVKCVW